VGKKWVGFAMLEIVGLDLSLTSTGIALPHATEALSPKQMGVERLIWIRDQIIEKLAVLNGPAVCLEGYSFGSRNSQAHAAGELGGVVRCALWENGFPFVEIPPTCRAKFATGRGNASKSEVVSAISARTGIVWDGKGADDRCDAWILQECGLTYFDAGRCDWPEINKSALKKIDWSPFDDWKTTIKKGKFL
jgi:Holliday junction resolvasome RuvABC endonuclease subunit